ncbi:hypothetical protein PALU110988_12495 [Paenibacillus lupini]|uniref:hypothetical protein n=1 Tax=Paenibacillus lupini TaxID=1450204 RepID=UPI001ABB6A52|nr:hypothetical protein [Paenibacillus lupini]NIK26272.1 transaldolase [Paenibacillus lupini]
MTEDRYEKRALSEKGISPFNGRLDDTGAYGMGPIEDLKTINQHYNLSAEIIAASICISVMWSKLH